MKLINRRNCRVPDPDPDPNPDPDWIRIRSDYWIRIRIRNLNTYPYPDPGQNDRQKVEKFMFKCCMAFLWARGFYCNLYILYEGLGIGKLQFDRTKQV